MDRLNFKEINIGVFMGGVSEERDISLKSGTAIAAALSKRGYAAQEIVVSEESEAHVRSLVEKYRLNAAFIALHGGFGEDGRLQAIFEKMRFPYTGSGPEASARAMDKIIFKDLIRTHHFLTPAWISVNRSNYRTQLARWQTFPCVVKPYASGSSKGVHMVSDPKGMEQCVEEILGLSAWAIVEEYIQGKEITVGVLEERPLTPIEIIPLAGGFFDYQSKYTPGATKYQLPARLDKENSQRVKQAAIAVHRLLGCSDLSRVDLIADASGTAHILELNSIPGFTAQSLLPRAAAYEGISFEDLCERIVERAAYNKNHPAKTGLAQDSNSIHLGAS